MNTTIILASSSPRRSQLLKEAGIAFEIVVPKIDETPLVDETPKSFVCRMAKEKAKNIVANKQEIILAADTVVVAENQILGKPCTKEEAKEMLLSLSDKTHAVMTGVCIHSSEKTELFCVETEVSFRKLTGTEIENYIATGEPMDKAGAYAIQGGAAKMVHKINGSYSNVVGLPLCEVVEKLESY